MLMTGWLSGLAVALAVLLSSASPGGPGKAWLPLVQSPRIPPMVGIAGASPAQVKALGGSWYYNFGPNGDPVPGVELVPMIYGADVPQTFGGNSRYVLGMNEPDLMGLSPAAAATTWRKLELAFSNKLLVSPAPSHLHPDWLVRFRDAYKAAYGRWPRLDGLAMHCYIPDTGGCIALGNQFVAWAVEWGVPEIWVTEFAFLPAWAPNAEGQAREFVAWMNANTLVKRYSPWTSYVQGGVWYWPATGEGTNPSLFTGPTSTQLTTMGRWYKQ